MPKLRNKEHFSWALSLYSLSQEQSPFFSSDTHLHKCTAIEARNVTLNAAFLLTKSGEWNERIYFSSITCWDSVMSRRNATVVSPDGRIKSDEILLENVLIREKSRWAVKEFAGFAYVIALQAVRKCSNF